MEVAEVEVAEVEVAEVEVAEVEVAEVEVAEVEVAEAEVVEEAVQEEDKRTPLQPPLFDSAGIHQKYSREKEKRQIASCLNSNDTTWPTSE